MKHTTDTVIPAEVTELIDESKEIQGWIDKLAELEDETTPAVYEKVHTDYRVRLSAVTSRLAEHRSGLSRSLEERSADAEALRTERDERAAELEEAQVRFSVGEFSSEEWDEQRGGIEGQLQSLKDRLATAETGLQELGAILASIPDGEGMIETAAGDTPEDQWQARFREDEAAVEAPETEAPPVAEAAQAEPEDPEAEFETADLETEVAEAELVTEEVDVPDETPEDTSETAATADEPEKAGGEAEGGEYLDELEFPESLSLAESDRFDAVSAMLEEEEGGKGSSE